MIEIGDVIQRLKDSTHEKPLWTDVNEISDLSTLDVNRSGLRGITLFVFQRSESAGSDVRGSGPYLQTLTETLGVVIVAKVVNSDKFNFKPVRKQLRERLFGWTPDDDHEPFWLGNGQLMNIQRGQITWIDNFITEYTEDQNRYGS